MDENDADLPVAARLPEPAGTCTAEDLTARQREVIGLLVLGYSNREIAEELYLSINSVKTHIRTAYLRIGVQRRSTAVLWGLQNGLLPGYRLVPIEPSAQRPALEAV
jgi:DNA-binding NarL/FixJ family response regulator